MKKRPYVGIKGTLYEVFTSELRPTEQSHPQYNAVIGPFSTVRGAKYMAKYGKGNPHLRTVADAEHFASAQTN